MNTNTIIVNKSNLYFNFIFSVSFNLFLCLSIPLIFTINKYTIVDLNEPLRLTEMFLQKQNII
jgi:hypothetical protein